MPHSRVRAIRAAITPVAARSREPLLYGGVVVILTAAPLILPPFALTLLTEALILGLLAMSLDLMVGYTRLVSFGHAAAYGLGAYTAGNILLHTGIALPIAVLMAAGLAGIVAIGVAWVCTLARGISFSMLTLA